MATNWSRRPFHPHQNGVLALRLGLIQRAAHIAHVGDRLAADIEDDIAGLETLARQRARPDRHP